MLHLWGFPHYTQKLKFGIGFVANGIYSAIKNDSLIILSNIALSGNVTTSGAYLLSISGNNFFHKLGSRLNYDLYFSSLPTKFWGIGYDNANDDANESSYIRKQLSGRVDYIFKILPNFYIGPSLGYTYSVGKSFSNPIFFIKENSSVNSICYGALINYDTRDFILNSSKGIYASIKQLNYINFNKKPFFNTIFQLNCYKSLGKGTIFATDFFSQFGYGDIPWLMLPTLGGMNQMRGYYEGRYIDNNVVTLQVELRQHIWNIIGAVIWAGCGNIWGEFSNFNFNNTLPNFGLGIRVAIKDRINLRLDWGCGKNWQNGFVFGINEAF